MSSKIHIIRTGFFKVNTLVVPLENKACFVVDPAASFYSGDKDAVTGYLKNHKLDCKAIILTHSHFDHITGIATVKEAFPKAKIAIHKAEINELINPPGPMGDSVIQFFGLHELEQAVAAQPPADIALVDDEVKELPHLVALSKRMMTTIKLNMTFSMCLNFVAIILAIIGTLNPIVGALVHNAGSVLVIINSSLLLKWRKK